MCASFGEYKRNSPIFFQHGTSNDIPVSNTAEIRHAKRGVCFLIPGSGVIVHMHCPTNYTYVYQRKDIFDLKKKLDPIFNKKFIRMNCKNGLFLLLPFFKLVIYQTKN